MSSLVDIALHQDTVPAPVRDLMRAAVASEQAVLQAASEHLIDVPGKGIRARLLLLMGAACSDEHVETVHDRLVTAAACVELMQAASLVHDDVLDGGDRRRGHPTVNVMYGNRVAVLVGDHLLACAARLAADLGRQAAQATSSTLREMVEGEAGETALLGTRSISGHLEIVRLKTASLFRLAASLGATLVGAAAQRRAAAAEFGEALGMLFQLDDDLKDLFGGDATKPPCADLKNGVLTLAPLAALASSRRDAAELDALLGTDEPADPAELRREVVRLGGYATAKRAAEAYATRAWLASHDLPDSPARTELQAMLSRG